MKVFCAIIGDIIESRKSENRFSIQNGLNKTLNHINESYRSSIESKFIITLGDEFQGLLSKPNNIFDIIDKIKMHMYPTQLRFGIGIGEISTEINPEMSIGADGPVYYYARDMINRIRKEEKSKINTGASIKLSAGEYKTLINEELINSTLALYSFIEKKWTEPQREKIYEFLKYEDKQSNIAKRLNVGQSSVNKGFKNAGFYNYLFAKKSLQNYLAEQWERIDV